MANYLQIFVFALALAQGYCAVGINTLPALISGPVSVEVQPMPLPVAPETEQPATPPCVSVIKSLLQAIIDRLGNLPGIVPLPETVPPQVGATIPELPEAQEVPEVPEVPVVQANPCTACFEHISSLLVTAQRLATLRALSRQ